MVGYLVTVAGDYFGTATEYAGKRQKFPYRITVKVPDHKGALSLIKNKLLDRVLRRNYPNYHMWRTHQLVNITNMDGSRVYGLTDPRLMDFDSLAEYVKERKLPLKLELYTDLGYFRTMVFLAETNQHEFLIKQENLKKDYEEDKRLAELNPELYGSQGLKPEKIDVPVKLIGQMTVTDKLEPVKVQKESKLRKTIITKGTRPVVDAASTRSGAMNQTAKNDTSVLITEDMPKVQKVEKVYVQGKGFVDAKDFEEDFERPDEKEFEVYDPTKISLVPSEGILVESVGKEVPSEGVGKEGSSEEVSVEDL